MRLARWAMAQAMIRPFLPRPRKAVAYCLAAGSLSHRPMPRSISARRSSTLPSRLIPLSRRLPADSPADSYWTGLSPAVR
jgi:hypothetical protein